MSDEEFEKAIDAAARAEGPMSALGALIGLLFMWLFSSRPARGGSGGGGLR